ncbi:glycerophosphodiester phosphodiesterase [uncultured Massilia sp.]|uniref:glycerophosphodiester phosphodiesterase n=1 Tax=uncultured Massilia sp. TaxID=169973 RepID=UPI0025F059E7|nr:glycerophosphodiester phosphodiesterase [uncultured Massilia sp.]
MDITPRSRRLLAGALALPAAVQAGCMGMQVHAHRGADGAPENSLSALRAAYEGGWDGVETDMQELGDGTWVIHHDALTGRVVQAGAPQPVRALDAGDWRAARMKLRGVATSEAPPFVSQVADLAARHPGQALNAEIKAVAGCADIGALAAELRGGVGHGNWFMTSVSDANLRCARQADPEGYLGLIVLDPRNAEALGSNRLTRALSSRARAPRLDAAWLARVRDEIGAPVGVHVDARTLDDNPALLTDAAAARVPVFVYAVAGDAALATSVRRARMRTGYWPSGVVVDGAAAAFCARLD